MRFTLPVTALAALFIFTSCAAKGPDNGIGLQLYSLRDDMKNDPVATIEKVGTMGYEYVETAGYGDGKIYGMEPAEFKNLCEDNDLAVLGAHAGQAIPESGNWQSLMPWWDECIAAHKEAGAEYIVQPFMRQSGYESPGGLKAYCDYFNAVGAKCKAAGIKFGYHNHDNEFKSLEGEVIYDFMLQNTDPDNVFFQLDIYWIYKGGADPFEYFEEYPGRFLSFHLKDDKELGESGKIDFKEIYKATEQAGAKYHVIEVEKYNHDPLVSVEKSLEHLEEIGYTE